MQSILAVDDSPSMRKMVSFTLTGAGYHVVEAVDGQDGSMPFCVELDNLKDTDAPIHQPAAMLVAAD